MSERDNIENLLGLTEYPSSSDDENTVPRPTATQGWHQQQPHQVQTSSNTDEVINVDEYPSPSAQVLEPTLTTAAVDQRGEQARVDRNLFWPIINNAHQIRWNRRGGSAGIVSSPAPLGYGSANESSSGAQGARLFRRRAFVPARPSASEPRSVVHEPVPELSQPQMSPSATADIMSIMAFRRLQRYRTYRRNRASSLGLLSRLPPLDHSRESSPRGSSRVHRLPTSPQFDSLLSSMMSFVTGGARPTRTSSPPEAERQPDEDAEQNDTDDIDNDQSRDETESVRLSPRLPVPNEGTPDIHSDNMEVDEPRGTSAQEDEDGNGDEESEAESAAAAGPAPGSGNNNNTPNEHRNASVQVFSDTHRRSRRHKRRIESERQRTEAFNVKEFNQNLLRLLECPVCLEWMEPPMLQCRLGHLVCARCRARLAACPVCRGGFSAVRNRAMEGVAELLRYPCRHGCGREPRLRRRAAHEASCPRRRYRCPACPAHACTERAPQPYEELLGHVQRNHAAMIKTGRLHKFSVKVNAQQHDNWLIMAGFGLFHLRVAVDIRTWSVMAYVAYIGPKCRAKEFTYEVTVVGQHNGRKLIYTRATHSDLESSSLNVSRQDCFHITLDEAINFLRFRNRHCQPDRLLDFTVEITKQQVVLADNSTISDD